MIKYVLFDLDGTLTDSSEGITGSLQYALGKVGILIEDRKELEFFIGPPLVSAARERYGLSGEDAKKMLDYYREVFSVTGLYENEVYQGIPRLLRRLSDSGIQCVLATSKPEIYAVKILEHFKLSGYFKKMVGNTLDDAHPSKAHIIAKALREAGVEEKSEAVMVGDRKYDIEGAFDNGIDSIGVAYGFGSETELREAGASRIAQSVEELEKMLFCG